MQLSINTWLVTAESGETELEGGHTMPGILRSTDVSHYPDAGTSSCSECTGHRIIKHGTTPDTFIARGFDGSVSSRWSMASRIDDRKSRFGSRGFTAMALFTLTLFRHGRRIHGPTYFEDAGQRSPVRDVATVVQSDGERPTPEQTNGTDILSTY